MKRLMEAIKDESGAVSVDFVVLSAGVVLMAMLIYPTISPAVSSMAEFTGESITKYEDFLK
jgi:hypothetical protein